MNVSAAVNDGAATITANDALGFLILMLFGIGLICRHYKRRLQLKPLRIKKRRR